MKALGHFFQAKGRRTTPARDKELLAVGKYHFRSRQPVPAAWLPAQATAPGSGRPQLPRLAGQHPRYIEGPAQTQFNKRERTNDNAVMHTIAPKLSELETHAVAEVHLNAGLKTPADRPRPPSAAFSGSVRPRSLSRRSRELSAALSRRTAARNRSPSSPR